MLPPQLQAARLRLPTALFARASYPPTTLLLQSEKSREIRALVSYKSGGKRSLSTAYPQPLRCMEPKVSFTKFAEAAAAQSCDSKAVSANGKPLHGAAKMSFVKKCKRDACGSKAASADGKPLHGAAKNSFMAKCMRTA
jgi:hypothetical protein